VHPLAWDDGLALAAQDHCRDTGSRGLISHEGVEGSTVRDRIARYGDVEGAVAENLSFGENQPDGYVASLFVDDGVEDRQNRFNMLNKAFTKVGIAYCPHASDYEGMVSIAYAKDFTMNGYGEREVKRRFFLRRKKSNVANNLFG